MEVSRWIDALVNYAVARDLCAPEDRTWLTNRLLEAMALDDYEP